MVDTCDAYVFRYWPYIYYSTPVVNIVDQSYLLVAWCSGVELHPDRYVRYVRYVGNVGYVGYVGYIGNSG